MRLHLLLLLCLFRLFTSINAQTVVERGKVIDSMVVTSTSDETFALYLPNSFVDNSPQPIVFIFEPMARGAVGIKPFIDASEKYGLILVCSNNSKNGPYDQNFAFANTLFNHVFSNFNIRQDEMYVSGFSGGSRLASAIASLTNRFVGVIGCGAGFSGLQEHMPATQDYAYVGLCGNRDMNYNEMLENKAYLNLINFNSTLITYNDTHNWPAPQQITRAFDWLRLQRIKKTNPAGIDEILTFYQDDYARLHHFLKEKEFLFASEQYERMINDYKDHIQIDSLDGQYRLFKKSKDYKKTAAALEDALKTEEKLNSVFRDRFSQEFEQSDSFNATWWKKELEKLSVLGEKGDAEIQKMVARVNYDLFARAYVRRSMLQSISDSLQIISLTQLLKLVNPKVQ
ncbi:hypothetical protein [Flagellimonas meishanensis]|uniref:hypothetical protein n=1 Tax=Flagellimonas meishanensis TaxID=2873264 RepID=UPI001CA74EE3|nr:hypothetical protein [[Muricauda] meishanensis]